jgi:uncharacterized protein (DUF2164 family)
MSVTLSPDDRKTAIASIERFCAKQLDFEASQIQATELLDFFLKEIAPSVSNAAISQAQAFLRDRVADLEGVCYEPEFTYWPKPTQRRK